MSNSSRQAVWNKLNNGSLAWTDFMEFMSHHWGYKFDQITEIYARNPNATFVASFNVWKQIGYRVNYRAKAALYVDGNGYFDVKATNAPDSFSSWRYKPEADERIYQLWKRRFPQISIENDIISNIINVSYAHLAEIKSRYGWKFTPEQDSLVIDSTSFAIMHRFGLNTDSCDFDFRNAVTILSNENFFQTYGQIILNILHDSLTDAKTAIRSYDKWYEQNQAATVTAINDKALFDELSERLFLLDRNGTVVTCKVVDVRSPNITLSDTENNGESFTISLTEFDDTAKEFISEEVQEVMQDVKETENSDDDLIAFAQSIAEQAAEQDIEERETQAESAFEEELSDNTFLNANTNQISFFSFAAEDSNADTAPLSSLPTKPIATQSVKPKQRRGRKAKEKTASPAPLVIEPNMEDHVLRCGANSRGSLERIVAWYQKDKSDEENAAFLRAEFTDSYHRYHDTTASRGYVFRSEEYPNGVHISAAFSDRLIITSGDTASLNIIPSLSGSWLLSAKRVKTLLENGEYCPQEIIDRAEDYELTEIAKDLWHLHQNTNKQIYDFFIPDETINHVFPEGTARLKTSLQNKETLQEYINGLEKFISDCEQNEDILRFKQFTPTLQELLSSLKDLRIERRQFTANPDFKFTAPEFFFTENEIDYYLTNYQPYSNGKFSIYEYFKEDYSRKEQADHLKDFFGTGGHYSGVFGFSYDPKGVEIKYEGLYGSEPIALNFTWIEVAEHIDNAVREERYITQDDIDKRIWHDKYTVEHYNPDKADDYDKREYDNAMAFLTSQGAVEKNETDTVKSVLPPVDSALVKELLKTEYMSGNTRLMKNSKDSVVDFFFRNGDETARTQFVSDNYDKGVYTETTVSTSLGERRVGFIADESGMLIWEGNYLTRTNESSLTWTGIADIISEMILDNTYYSAPDQSVTLMSDAAEVTEVVSSADTVAEIRLKYQGESDSLEKIRDMALSLGAIVLIDNAESTIDIDTYENHREEINSYAEELGLTAIIEQDNYAITIYKVGNFYEMYDDDARLASVTLDLHTSRKGGRLMCGFPDHAKDSYTARLVDAGYSVVEAEQEQIPAKVSDLAVGDVIMYDSARREVTELSADSIKLKDLDHPDYDGLLVSTSDVLAYEGWQEDMESKGFEILSKANELYEEEVFAFDNTIRYYIKENNEHHFNVQIQTKTSDTDTYVYSGVGRFTDTLGEAHDYIERDIQIRTIRNSFDEYYDTLYNEGDAAIAGETGYRLALQAGDTFIKEQRNPELVSAFNELRHDILSSDREIAAFAFSLQDAGLIERFIPQEDNAQQTVYEIYQLKNNNHTRDIRFVSLDRLRTASIEPNIDNYDKVYEGDFSEFVTDDNTIEQQLEALYTKFNVARPSDFEGHSLAVSDVVVVNDEAYYVDTFGFRPIDNFIKAPAKQQEEAQLETQPDKPAAAMPDAARPRARIMDVTATRNYKHIMAAFPAIMSHQYSYMQFSAGESFDKLNLEWIARDELAISHTFVQNGDLMRDPEIVVKVDNDYKTVFPIEYQNDTLNLYGRYEEGDSKSKDCNRFLTQWLNNIDAQGYSLIHSVRWDSAKQEDVSKDYDFPLEEERYDLFYQRTGSTVDVFCRLHIKSISPDEFLLAATINEDYSITYHDQTIPNHYKTEIENYSSRISTNADIVSAYSLVRVFNFAKEGKTFDDKFDMLSLQTVCNDSRLYDNDLIEFIGRVISDPNNISTDDYEYAISMVAEIIDGYDSSKSSDKYGAVMFITDEQTENDVFNQISSSDSAENKIREKTEAENTAAVEQATGDLMISADVPAPIVPDETEEQTEESTPVNDDTDSNPLDFKVGDIVTTMGSDRQFVITEINAERNTATIRDDNTGWYPLFQELPFYQLSALAEQNEMQHSFNPDDDSIVVEGEEEIKNNYVITDDNIGVATPKIRVGNNIAAIEIVNTLLKEHRDATEEEKSKLAQYVGWGSLPDVFDERKDNYSSERTRLRELLTEKEYESARESTLTAFYTQPVIIRAVYTALKNMGFDGGKILEPAMGVGNFFGAMPQELAASSELYGVEIDRITGNIAKQLYPNADIAVKGFEDFKAPDNSFDVVIGNVPFADFKVFDPRYNKHNLLIHDYFFAKAIDKCKAGGIVAFITSKGTLDKKNSNFRRMLCEKAELLGAIRLPSTAFKDNAGTEVISDIIFLKKRNSISAVRDTWVDTTYSDTALTYINNYFIENPYMVCGQLSSQSTQYGFDIDVKPFENVSLEQALMERIAVIQGKFEPINRMLDLEADKSKEIKYIPLVDDSIPPYRYGQLADGTIAYREGDRLRIDNISKNAVKYYKAAIRLSKAVRYIVNVQQETPDGFNDDIINNNFELARQELNEAYDAFAKLGLTVNDTKRRGFKFDDDNNFGLMASLEKQITQPDGKKVWIKSSDLFERRTIVKHREITHCDSLNDAFTVCLNAKSRVDIDYICKLTDKQPAEVIGELNGSYIYRNPQTYDKNDITSGWETADEYLSGNIRAKLQFAKDAAAADTSFAINVTALEGVMPEKIPASEITVQLGASWVPVSVIEDFMNEVFQFPAYVKMYCKVEHDISTATWYISDKSMGRGFTATKKLYGTDRITGMELLEDALNMRRTTIYDRVTDENGEPKSVKNPEETQKARLKQDMLKQAFVDWIWKDPTRTRNLEEIYNFKYNSERVRRFDGSHLTFDEMNTSIELQPHQKNAVARIMYGGNSLLAHVVGAGKTFEISAACMELKRTGAANKALIVVPNHLIGQWGKEFQTLYPAANILLARQEDFKKDKRRIFLGRIATGDYDAIIMGYSTFTKIGVSRQRRERFYRDEIETCCEHLQNCKHGSLTEKQLQKYKKQLEGNLKNLEYSVKQDKEITFEELGVDWLYIDEAHNFKNLMLNTKLGQIAGISTANSKRAEDLLLKIRYINEMQGAERGVVLATGTPISNSLVEMYTMQRYLQNKYLEEKGISHFDAWAADFAKIESTIELDPTGVGFRNKTRCAAFNNLPELMVMFNRCTDIQTAEMLDLPVPKLKDGQYTICVCQPSDEQKEYVKDCGKRAERIHCKQVDPTVDNMLKVTNDGKMCALDMRLVDPEAEDNPDSKVNIAIENIYDKWLETKSDRLTQIVFLDRSTPKPNEFNLYDDIRNKLVERGIPKSEIRFIHEAKNDNEKLKLFDEVNAGLCRIIIGSTEKMGAGTNIQERLCALHHLDVPWRPSDIEQREGRILRRGNINKEVEIFRYVTEKTFDSYSWQTIESKQKFISQVMTGNAAGRSAEDVDSAVMNYAEIKALATGDPRIKEHFDLTDEVNRLRLIKGSFDKAHIDMRDRLAFELPKIISEETNFVKMFKAEKEYSINNSQPFDEETNPFTITFGGKTYDKREDAGTRIMEIIRSGAAYHQPYLLGKYRGFDLEISFSAAWNTHVFNLRHLTVMQCEVGESTIGMFKRIDNLIDHNIDALLGQHSTRLTAAVKDMEICKQHANEEFPQKEELAQKEMRLAQLTKELAFDDHSEGDNLVEKPNAELNAADTADIVDDDEPIIENGNGRK